MELQCSPTAATKVWKILKLAFFMMRSGLASKRKLMLDINLVMQRGKLLGKSLGNLMFHHHHRHQQPGSSAATPDGHAYGPDEYEFSCSNTPIPTFVPVNSKRKHSYFPCIGATPVDEPDSTPGPAAVMLPRIDCSPQRDLASGERQTPGPSPFSVRVSNYSRAEDGDVLSCEVDSKAEEFIKKFYRQLHAEGRISMLE